MSQTKEEKKLEREKNLLAFEAELETARDIEDPVKKFTATEKLFQKVHRITDTQDFKFGAIWGGLVPLTIAAAIAVPATIAEIGYGTAVGSAIGMGLATGFGGLLVLGALMIPAAIVGLTAKAVTKGIVSLLPDDLESKVKNGWKKIRGGPSYSKRMHALEKKIEGEMDAQVQANPETLSAAPEVQKLFDRNFTLQDDLKEAFMAKALKTTAATTPAADAPAVAFKLAPATP